LRDWCTAYRSVRVSREPRCGVATPPARTLSSMDENGIDLVDAVAAAGHVVSIRETRARRWKVTCECGWAPPSVFVLAEATRSGVRHIDQVKSQLVASGVARSNVRRVS
jgi:hypothetical protein